ncbi:MAG: ATP-binding cassette domain-containing protein [Lachnospiraceae bacterium]|jgi:ABC superfamily ATP binding cassette transporter,ABC protein|nr:ATP-binding cassette domain-containing protein [Lachnospiraceae bacterium]MBF1132553.1 ATP-binding cassette domain-containing protein [Dialister invisus]MBF0998604.1 ATP-binding cassette domain-containing protein [Lachnospiraceae bacterium]MBF1000774.1 ATP-binding cassette domain-containing protein [Lachnospiraceae bacterium]MBF1005108.1 ATP-binding cassette domain-containing protein [Lachnospiraceae bacterium]
MNYILETNHLSKQSGKTYRVHDLSMAVPKKCVYGFLGPNGAGKSTTLKMILGLVHPSQGSIKLFGKVMNSANRLSILRQTGSLIENPGGYGHLTGLENMQIIQKLKGVNEAEIASALKTVRLYDQRDKKLSNYSLGMKQRLGIAMAILGNPKLLILDEPTNGLDPAGIQEMRQLICSLPKERNMTVIISSHLLSEIEQMADQVGIIHHGHMLYQGTLANLETQGDNLEDVFLEMTGGKESL